jgi:hypothetical protein
MVHSRSQIETWDTPTLLGCWEKGEFGVDAFGWGADGGIAFVVDDVAYAAVAEEANGDHVVE